MSFDKDTDNESARQQQIDNLQKRVKALSKKLAAAQSGTIEPGVLYRRSEVEARLGIGDNTLTGWIDQFDLPSIQPGTTKQYFHGSELIDFMIRHRAGLKLERTAKGKASARQAKEEGKR